MANKANLYLRNVPRTTKDEFRSWCVRRGKSMNQVIIEFMRSIIEKDRQVRREDSWLKEGGAK